MSEQMVDETARVITVAGELDASCAPAFKQKILDALGGGRPVVLDLSDVTYIDSTSVGAMFSARKEKGITEEKVAVVCSGEIRRMFEITGLDLVFDIFESRDEAVQSLAPVT